MDMKKNREQQLEEEATQWGNAENRRLETNNTWNSEEDRNKLVRAVCAHKLPSQRYNWRFGWVGKRKKKKAALFLDRKKEREKKEIIGEGLTYPEESATFSNILSIFQVFK